MGQCNQDQSEIVLQVSGLSKEFVSGRRSVKAVDNVSFYLKKGEVLALAGESGSGKSTIARLVTQLISPDAGTISVCGETYYCHEDTRERSKEGISGERISGEGISGEGISGEGNSGEGNSGEGNSGERISGEGISGEGISGEGNSGEGITERGKGSGRERIFGREKIAGRERIFESGRISGRERGSLDRKTLRRLRTHIQMIFQNAEGSFHPRMRIGEAMAESARNFRPDLSRAQALELMHEYMALVGLPEEIAGRYPWQISGGQCQRAAIVRALCAGPDILICDEATSALDVLVQARIMEILRNVQEKTGMSMLFISHDLSLVNCISDRVLILQQGRCVEQGETSRILHHPEQEYTRLFLDSIL